MTPRDREAPSNGRGKVAGGPLSIKAQQEKEEIKMARWRRPPLKVTAAEQRCYFFPLSNYVPPSRRPVIRGESDWKRRTPTIGRFRIRGREAIPPLSQGSKMGSGSQFRNVTSALPQGDKMCRENQLLAGGNSDSRRFIGTFCACSR